MITNYSSVVIKVRYFLIIYMILLLMSCELFYFHEDLEIRFPGTDNQIFQLHNYHWILQYQDSGGSLQTVLIDSSRESLFLTMEKGKTQAVILSAQFNSESGNPFQTKPAGFIYGFSDVVKGEYVFDWEMGFESLLLLDLSAYMDLEQLNIYRLLESIEMEAECENHWIIDGSLILEELLAGEFRIYDIRKMREREISITIPAGEWCNGNLMGEDLFSLSSLSDLQVQVPTGSSSYIHSDGYLLEIKMDEDGSFDYIVY